MKSIITLLALAFIGSATAATVSISVSTMGTGSKSFAEADGDLLLVGSSVRVGYFDSALGSMATLGMSNDYTQLNSMFRPLAENTSLAGSIFETGATGSMLIVNNPMGSADPATGTVFGQIQNIESTYIPAGSNLYMWVFNAADPMQASEWGIFTATVGWAFPTFPGSNTLNTNEITAGDVIRGSMTGTQLRLSAVPEPGSLVLIVALGAMLRRRMR
jgi:hypothetical protein